MHDPLLASRTLAEAVRFAGDNPAIGADAINENRWQQFRAIVRHSDLLISESVTPQLSETLGIVFERLQLSAKSIEAYVYESPEIQAQCLLGHHSACVIRFSSGLIRLLSLAEFQFVAGHELGHFLLTHRSAPDESSENLEMQIVTRAREISADRLGLVACGDLNVAIRAMMKSASGLPNEYLRFDVASFISQLANTEVNSIQTAVTHPSFGVRCRALLWFSLTPEAVCGNLAAVHKDVLDSRVTKDLNRYIDAAANETIQRTETALAMWLSIKTIASDGRYSKIEQAWITETFGSGVAASVANMLAGSSQGEALILVVGRSEDALAELKQQAPHTWQERLQKAEKIVASIPK